MFEIKSLLSQGTLMNDQFTLSKLAVVTLTQEHIDQRDKELNKLIWSIHPLDLESTHRESMAKVASELSVQFRPRTLPEDSINLLLTKYETGLQANKLVVLARLHRMLCRRPDVPPSAQPQDPMEVLKDRQMANKVEPLPQLLTRLEKRKKTTNMSHFKRARWTSALLEYYKCILALYPWAATPLLFNADQAFQTTIAQFEAGVWSNMAVVLRRLDLPLSFACSEIAVGIRFVPHTTLWKAYTSLNDCVKKLAEHNEGAKSPKVTKNRVAKEAPSHIPHEDTPLLRDLDYQARKEVESGAYGDLSSMIKKADAGSTFVHGGCVQEHVTCVAHN